MIQRRALRIEKCFPSVFYCIKILCIFLVGNIALYYYKTFLRDGTI